MGGGAIVSSIYIIRMIQRDESKKANVEWTDQWGYNCFHRTCQNNPPVDIVQSMIDIAGKDIIFETTDDDWIPFHIACYSGASIDVIKIFIDVGGKELLMIESTDGWTVLGIELWKLC